MVHSGGAQGGHYYAFMKDLKRGGSVQIKKKKNTSNISVKGNWLKVDDAKVTKITEEEVKVHIFSFLFLTFSFF